MANPDLKALTALFPYASLQWQVGNANAHRTSGQALPQLDIRELEQRLDDVLTPSGWQVSFTPSASGTVITCVLSIRIGNEWISKSDVSHQLPATERLNLEYAVKGAAADAFRRAASRWGIGRYLYRFKEAPWIAMVETKKFKTLPPLPDYMLREEEQGTQPWLKPSEAAAGAGTPDSSGSEAIGLPQPAGPAGAPETGETPTRAAAHKPATPDDKHEHKAIHKAKAAPRQATEPAIGTPEQWEKLSAEDKATILSMDERIRTRSDLRGVRGFLSGKRATKLPAWARDNLKHRVDALLS